MRPARPATGGSWRSIPRLPIVALALLLLTAACGEAAPTATTQALFAPTATAPAATTAVTTAPIPAATPVPACCGARPATAARTATATPTIAAGTVTPAIGTRVDVQLDRTAIFQAEGLTLRFIAVTEESRCPRSTGGRVVNCAHAGRASITLEATRGDESRTLTLTIPGLTDDTTRKTDGEAAGALFAGYRIQLVSLEPQPLAGPDPAPRAYTATLLVTPGGESRGGRAAADGRRDRQV